MLSPDLILDIARIVSIITAVLNIPLNIYLYKFLKKEEKALLNKYKFINKNFINIVKGLNMVIVMNALITLAVFFGLLPDFWRNLLGNGKNIAIHIAFFLISYGLYRMFAKLSEKKAK